MRIIPISLSILLLLFSFVALGQNVNLSNGAVFDGEPYLSVNPNNSQHMVVAWMGYVPFNNIVIKTKATFDGGQSWTNAVYIPHTNPLYGSADPSLEFDNAGNIFMSYVDYSIQIDSGSVYVTKSTDGGLSWGSPVEVINAHADPGKYPVDRPWITVDHTGGVHDGNVYVTSMPPNVFGPLPPPYHPYFVRSTDGGNTFDQWRFIDTTNWLAGSTIPQPTPFSTMSANGVFHCVYPSWVFAQNPNPQFIFASTDNAGNSFSYSALALPFNIIFGNTNDTLAKKGYPLVANPADTNHLAFFNLIVPHGDADVYMWESFDGGVTWSDSIRINDDPIGNDRMQDLIWADFDTDGDLVVSWRDRRNASDSIYATSTEIWAAFRHKDSINFSANFRISDTIVAYDSVLALSGNDFMCIKLVNDTLNAVWGDARSGKLNIWFQRMKVDGTLLSIHQLSSESNFSATIFPNPFNNSIFVEAKKIMKVIIYDTNGRMMMTLSNQAFENNMEVDLSSLSRGTYLISVVTEGGIQTGKIIKH